MTCFPCRLLAACVLMAMLSACSSFSFEPPQRSGPIVLVDTGSGKQAWMALTQEEERSRHVGGGSRRIGKWITEYRHHLRLQAHDPATAQRLWAKDIKVVLDKEGGRNAQIRILGQQGEVVWVWVHDQVLALSARDGGVAMDRASLVKANPGIADLLPKELKYYTWFGDLVITLADGRRMRIGVPGFRAEPYQVTDERQFSQSVSLGTTWNGGYETKTFGVRHGRFDGEWIGLLSDKEARDAENDASGDNYADSASIDDEGELARRTFWRVSETAFNDDFLSDGGRKGVQGFCEEKIESIEGQEDMQLLMRSNDIEEYARNRGADPAIHRKRVRECIEDFDEEKYKRIVRLERIAGDGEWLQGRLLKQIAKPGEAQWVQRGILMNPAVRPPLRLQGPDSVLVLYRTRMDAEGRLALSRVDTTFSRTVWTAVLPYAELNSRWETGSHLVLYGTWSDTTGGVTSHHEALVSLNLATGQWQGWNVGADQVLPAQ